MTGKAWQEAEFADYKQRQIRRRAQRRARRKKDEARSIESKQVRIVPILTGILLLTVLGVIGWLKFGRTTTVPRDSFRIASVRGSVEVVSDVKDWPARNGEAVAPGLRVRTAEGAKVTLRGFVNGTRITLFGDTLFAYKAVRLSKENDQFQLDCELLKGEAVFELRNREGLGLVRVRTPQAVDAWGNRVLFRVIVRDDKARFIVADGVIMANKGDKKTMVPSDREMVSTFDTPLTKPRPCAVLRMGWQ